MHADSISFKQHSKKILNYKIYLKSLIVISFFCCIYILNKDFIQKKLSV